MHEGFHHTNDMEAVAEKYFPGSEKIHSETLLPTEESKKWFQPLHMTCVKVNVYKFNN